ncbi:ABC-2 transporter permease [Bifidobacterium scardovii]|uniref:Membrane protein n=1 Tax=Bifidobacterium scardovii TaxID=158787 RepID=A0A087D561_9BIFI|nr:ABC-2 transporter permease [Bifidobacterium scardovii]KFI90661.1 membrane protein [Bifidobacterium scardovii]MDK6350237.1 ABC-2 transporter permease [Bifidobacterium scardovii]MDU8981353.1 ABC-2 transporter permease [Bifidobacterium scardovii]BAQ31637.1 putative ABC transporter permease component [Bifidobacterium scardovii JCM 12489 = DSM 13734]
MIRAFRFDLAAIAGNAAVNLTVTVALCVFVGLKMQSVPMVFAAAIFMAFPMVTLSLGMYDELGTWSVYRLSLPVSRRDLVFGRYLTAVAMIGEGFVIAVASTALMAAVSGVWSVASPRSAPLMPASMLAAPALGIALVTASLSILVSVLLFGVITPMYYRLGMTKLTRVIPGIGVLGSIALVALFGGASDRLAAALPAFVDWLQRPASMALVSGGMLAAAVAVMAVSLAVSVRVYETREI